jgi:hypothetical protein
VANKYSKVCPDGKTTLQKKNNMKNQVKNAIRHLVTKAYEVFAANKSNVSLVSLPGSVWEFETNVINHNDFANNFGKAYELEMFLYECDANKYESNLRPISTLFPHNKVSSYVLSRNRVEYFNQYANGSFINSVNSDNIFAWFDFCGNPTTNNLNLINTAIGKNVTYVFTFNTHWRCDTNVDSNVLRFANATNKAVAIHAYLKTLADTLGLTVVWSFEYVSNHNPMITVCLSNDANVLADKSFRINNLSLFKNNKTVNTNTTIKKEKTAKRDLSAVYADYKNKMDDKSICDKHNITRGTLAAVKAWVTMGK